MTTRHARETDMLWDMVSGQVYRKEYTEHLVLALYSSIVSENEDYTVNVTRSRKEDLFNRFIELVEMTSQKMDIPYFAERLHVAPHYLSRVISEISGITVMDWIRKSVILQSKVLLRTIQRPARNRTNGTYRHQNTDPAGIPSSSPNIEGFTARIYDMVRKVVIPATISVRK